MVYIPQRQGFGKADFAGGMATGALRMFTQVMLHRKQREEQLADEERGTLNQRALLDYQNMLAGKRSDVTFGRQQTRDETQHGYDMTEIQERARLTEEAAKRAATAKGTGIPKPIDESEAATTLRKFDYTPEKIGDTNFALMTNLLTRNMLVPEARELIEKASGGKSLILDKRFDQEEREKMGMLDNYVTAGYMSMEERTEAGENPNSFWRHAVNRQFLLKKMDITEPIEETKAWIVREGMINKIAAIVGLDAKTVNEKSKETSYPTIINGENLDAALTKLVGLDATVPPGDYGIDDVAIFLIEEGVLDDMMVQRVIAETMKPGSVEIPPPIWTTEGLGSAVGGAASAIGEGAKGLLTTKPPPPRQYHNLFTEPYYGYRELLAKGMKRTKQIAELIDQPKYRKWRGRIYEEAIERGKKKKAAKK